MATVLGTLGELGYGWAYRVLDAQHFGVAQRRRRVFIVGRAGGCTRCAGEVLFEREGVCRDPSARGETGKDVAGTLGGSSQSGGFRTTDLDNNGALVFESRYVRNDRGAPDTVAPPLKAENGGTGKGDGAPLVFAPTQVTSPATASALTSEMYHHNDVPNQTVASYGQQLPIGRVRRLTPTECERLQGFPDGWTAVTGQADSHRYRQLGNAVAVPVAEWIARRIAAIGDAS